MVEEAVDIVITKGAGPSRGLVNTSQAEEYQLTIKKIFEDFREDHKDALATTIKALKRHMVKTWDQIAAVELDAVLCTVHELSFVTL